MMVVTFPGRQIGVFLFLADGKEINYEYLLGNYYPYRDGPTVWVLNHLELVCYISSFDTDPRFCGHATRK